MKLAKLPFLEKKGKPDYFLALILRNEKAISVIFEKIGSTIKYISHGEEDFENTIEDAETEHFLNVLDKVITSAEASLPDNIETHKTLFGLKENWVENNKIKKEYLEKLKKASDELSLDPIGFVVFSESIVNLVQKEEGAPITAILAEIGKKYITVSLIKAGKILETRSSEIHQSPSYTVDTLLKHFAAPEVMPSRIILFDSEEEELAQEFIGHSWSKSLPFLHLPQISNLPKDSAIKAMLLGAATQMGTELIFDSTRIDLDETPSKLERIKPDETEEVTPIENPSTEPEVNPPIHTEPSLTPDFVDTENSMEFFGFLENADIAKTPTPKVTGKQKNIPEEVVKENIEEIPQETKFEEEEKTPPPVNAALVTGKIKLFLPKLMSLIKKINLGKIFALLKIGGGGNKKLLVIPAIILILIVIVLYMYLFTTKAIVTINVSPKSDQKTASVTFSPTSSTDVKNGILATEFVTVSEDGSVSTATTGNKDVGTPAKGTVTVFNNDSSSVSFAQGTKVTSGNDLVFTMDKSVTVSSASGDIFSGTTPGTATVTVTANDIGQQFNLPSGSKFSIAGTTTAAAKNDNAFSGGTKKTVKVVSKDDLNKLLAALPKQLEDKARTDVMSKATDGKTILSSFLDETVDKQTFDKKVDDAADQVSLNGSVTFETASYNNSDMLSLASSVFNSSGEEISKDNLNVTAKNIVVAKNKDVSADVTIKVALLPKIVPQDLAKQIAGISLQKAKNMILNLPQVGNVDIKLRPNFFFLPQNLPGSPNRITVTVNSL